jgi:hypothetical protein
MILPIFNKKDVVVKLFNGEVETAYEGYEAQNCEFSLTGNGKIFNTTEVIFPKCTGKSDIVNGMKVYHKDKLVLEGSIPEIEIPKIFQPIFEIGTITNQLVNPDEIYNCSICGTQVSVNHIDPPVFNCNCEGAKVIAEMEAVANGKSSLAM